MVALTLSFWPTRTAKPFFLAHLPRALAYQYMAGTPSLGTVATASGIFPPPRILASKSGDAATMARSPHFTALSMVARYSFSLSRR